MNNLRIVLVETSHPGNIGAVARAMKNMCLSDLVLVSPLSFPNAEATSRASGADDILASARVVSSLDEAVSDCVLVAGASARLRNVSWPQMNPRECAQAAWEAAKAGKVALVFGREQSGLSNTELERCHYLVHIPSNPEYSSLNVAMAAQVLAYELMMQSVTAADGSSSPQQEEAVTAGDMQGLFDHLAQMMEDIGFADPEKSSKLVRRLKRLFYRAAPEKEEINILRGIFSAAQGRKSARRVSASPHAESQLP